MLDLRRALRKTGAHQTIFFTTWFVFAGVGLAIKSNQLFIGLDGGYIRDLARRQFAWSVPLFSSSIDYFQGVGDVFFSGANNTLFPSFVMGQVFGVTDAAKVAIYLTCIVEVTLAIFLFARTIGASRTVSFAGALLMPLLTFPFQKYGAVYGIFALSPQNAEFIAASLIIAVCYLKFGRVGLRHDWFHAVAILAILFWMVHAGILGLILAGPSLLLAGVSGLIVASGRTERVYKISLVVVTAALFAAPFLYLAGLVLNSAPITSPLELENNRSTWLFASILFHWYSVGPAGPLLVIAAVIGAFIISFDRTVPMLRVFAITLLTYLGTRLSFWLLTVLFDFWRGPSALYFEFFVFPLYAIFATHFVIWIVRFFWIRIGYAEWTTEQTRVSLVVGASALALTCAAFTRAPKIPLVYPPAQTALTSLLRSEVGLSPPGPFRGRVATLTGRTIDHGVSWLDLHSYDFSLEHRFGNEMRLVGLNFFDVPALFQYGSTMTPAFYALTSRFLSDPRDTQMRSVSAWRRYDPKLLALLGVRFVITDSPINGLASAKEEVSGVDRLFAYRLSQPNTGDYSPTEVVPPTRARDFLMYFGRQEFDPRKQVVASLPIVVDVLTPAVKSRYEFDGVAIHIAARSEGHSLLVLPLEFSRCLMIEATSGAPSLFRADLLLTGVLFTGELDATIRLHTGPYIRPMCRLADLKDLIDFGVRDLPNVLEVVGQH